MPPAVPKVSAAGGVHVVGLTQFLVGLQVASAQAYKAMGTAHRRVAAVVVKRAKSKAPGDTGSAIKPIGKRKEAIVRVGAKPGRAIGTFMGANRKFGWYAAAQFSGSGGRQFQPWVGNQWDPGQQEGKPYHIGDPINAATEDALEIFQDEIAKVYRIAYPIKTG